MIIPRIVIAGTNSGCGKTTIAIGIMAALNKRGLKVQPYKTGPDYIDTLFHEFVTEHKGRNLDSWLLDIDTLKYVFCNGFVDSEIAVIEGAMGLYDGLGTTDSGSTAHISKLLSAPVILVIDATGMSMSAAATVKGFSEFDKKVNISGIIINNIKSRPQYELLKEIIEKYTDIEVIGFLFRNTDIKIDSRHLGLKSAVEVEDLETKINKVSISLEETLNFERLIEIAMKTEELYYEHKLVDCKKNKFSGLKIGVAYDKSFNFYYNDNIDLLKYMGAEIEFFSPLTDKMLPRDLDGIYIGGGYPEVYGERLAANVTMRKDIIDSAENGMTIYAECGGLMYLTESITDKDNKKYDMVGVFNGNCNMTSRLRRFGYVDCEVTKDCILGSKGTKIKGHEFHYSIENIENINTCLSVAKIRIGKEVVIWESGYMYKNVVASYPHIHFLSNISIAESFLNSCKENKI